MNLENDVSQRQEWLHRKTHTTSANRTLEGVLERYVSAKEVGKKNAEQQSGHSLTIPNTDCSVKQ